MTSWTGDELTRVGEADELEIAARRPDGALRKPVTADGVNDAVDAAYRTKYERYDDRYVSPEARATTLKLVPRER